MSGSKRQKMMMLTDLTVSNINIHIMETETNKKVFITIDDYWE
jgi:hypothetical protein